VRGAGEEVGYGVGVPAATCGTGGISGEAYRSSEVVQGGGGGGYLDVDQFDVLFVNSDYGGLKFKGVGWVWRE